MLSSRITRSYGRYILIFYIGRPFDVINCGDMMDDLRGIHDKYDVIMLLVIVVWLDSFLEFMGIDLKIDEVLSTKHSTLFGERRLMDFIFRGMDFKIYDVEFDFPHVTHERMSRYFFYNILAETAFKGIVESIIINFTKKTGDTSSVYRSGFSKSFHPRQYYSILLKCYHI